GSSVEGPRVATILVLRNIAADYCTTRYRGRPWANRRRAAGARLGATSARFIKLDRAGGLGCSGRSLFEHGHCRKCLALDELEESTSPGRDVGDVIGDAVLVDGGEGVAASGNGEGITPRYCFSNDASALTELVKFEDADRTVPDNR